MYEFFYTGKFSEEYDHLPKNLQKAVDKQLGFLEEDLFYPSLNTKRVSGTRVWEARVTRGYRFTFTKSGNTITLLTIGPHDVGLGKK